MCSFICTAASFFAWNLLSWPLNYGIKFHGTLPIVAGAYLSDEFSGCGLPSSSSSDYASVRPKAILNWSAIIPSLIW